MCVFVCGQHSLKQLICANLNKKLFCYSTNIYMKKWNKRFQTKKIYQEISKQYSFQKQQTQLLRYLIWACRNVLQRLFKLSYGRKKGLLQRHHWLILGSMKHCLVNLHGACVILLIFGTVDKRVPSREAMVKVIAVYK